MLPSPRTAPKRLTHFLCIPLITPSSRPQVTTSLATFRTDPVTSTTIPEKAIRPLGTLHFTLGVMTLLTPERVDGALSLLKNLDIPSLLASSTAGPQDVGKAKSKAHEASLAVKEGEKEEDALKIGYGASEDVDSELKVTLTGLVSMHNPSSTSILYAAPYDPSGRLQRFGEALRDAFVFGGFMNVESRALLLHATIVNTIYVPGVRAESGKGGHGKWKAKLTLDVRDVLENYGDFNWMSDINVEKVAICKMGARVNAKGEEEYVVEGEVDVFP